MMWRKAMLFGNQALAREILTVEHPGHAKSLGRQVENFDEEEWNEARYQIVVTGNVAKFGQNPDLKKFLLVTGSRVLVEASPVDRIWGIGVAADDPRAQDPGQWRGSNLLGFALMDARTELSELG
ncbi:hypothetical protein NRB20_38100 [Nocardia sp. RB20]|uniref:NADAR domain-containing protein n=2 Tax=Nocardia macrotermitis TaxID=2585198 RepID=A0A7K0D5Y8_9NOCA|nr:hypothetical protein [Nocardia macrotermitis]